MIEKYYLKLVSVVMNNLPYLDLILLIQSMQQTVFRENSEQFDIISDASLPALIKKKKKKKKKK